MEWSVNIISSQWIEFHGVIHLFIVNIIVSPPQIFDQYLKANVSDLKLIQVGLTLNKADGKLSHFRTNNCLRSKSQKLNSHNFLNKEGCHRRRLKWDRLGWVSNHQRSPSNTSTDLRWSLRKWYSLVGIHFG